MNKHFIIITFFFSTSLTSQILSDNFEQDMRVMNFASQFALDNIMNTTKYESSFSDIEGSEYFDNSFKTGTIENLNRDVYIKTPMRYNAFSDEIELVIVNNGIRSVRGLIKNEKIIPNIEENQYFYLNYKKSKGKLIKGYLISLYKGKDIELFLKKRKKFLKGRVAKNSLDVSHPPKYVDDIEYYIRNNSDIPTYIKNSKKNIIDYFNKSKELKEFIRSENLNLDNSESIIRLIKFYEGSVAN